MSCILCEQKNLKIISRTDSKNNSSLNIFLCNVCGMVQQNPIPSEDEVNEYYSSVYRQDYKKTYVPKIKHVFRAGNLGLDRISFLKNRGIDNGSLLDVGAGGGEFTYLSSKLGFMSQGIEPNIGYSSYAREEYGIKIETGQLSDVHGKFKVITMFHALEHIPDVVKAFELLFNLLEKNGHLLIEVPNIETNDASPHNIYFKAHIHYFSSSTLVSAASKYFDKIDMVSDSNLRVLFKRKEVVSDLILPSFDQVAKTTKRLQKKGWLEYIFKGGGYKKLPLRLSKIFIESRIRHKSGIKILNDMIKYH
jgi:2-polyprenyl-3-methyl-5-hydroxy-6-metoxy-1,4-benzoquinol methylase